MNLPIPLPTPDEVKKQLQELDKDDIIEAFVWGWSNHAPLDQIFIRSALNHLIRTGKAVRNAKGGYDPVKQN